MIDMSRSIIVLLPLSPKPIHHHYVVFDVLNWKSTYRLGLVGKREDQLWLSHTHPTRCVFVCLSVCVTRHNLHKHTHIPNHVVWWWTRLIKIQVKLKANISLRKRSIIGMGWWDDTIDRYLHGSIYWIITTQSINYNVNCIHSHSVPVGTHSQSNSHVSDSNFMSFFAFSLNIRKSKLVHTHFWWKAPREINYTRLVIIWYIHGVSHILTPPREWKNNRHGQ